MANCDFAQDSSGFPVLLPFFDARSGRCFRPFDCRPDSVARSWRRPFRSRGIASPQTPTPDRESLPATIAESIRVGPHLRRLAGALAASNSSAPFRNRTEALDPVSPSQSHEPAKVPHAVLTESPDASPARKDRAQNSFMRSSKSSSVIPTGAARESPNRSPWGSTSPLAKTWFAGFSPITTGRDRTPVVPPGWLFWAT